MESLTVTPMVQQQLGPSPILAKQAYLLLAILKVLFRLFLSLVQGVISLDDVLAQFQALRPDCPPPSDTTRSSSPVSDIQSDSTCTVPDENISPRLVSTTRALCRAIVRRDIKAVTRMLEASPHLAGKRHEGGWYPLHAAALSGDIELVKLVLSYPIVDVNVAYQPSSDETSTSTDREYELGTRVEDIRGATPLHFASMIGNIEIIRLLASHGALFKTTDEKNREPVHYCDIQDGAEAITVLQDLYIRWKARDDFFRDDAVTVEDLAQMIRDNKYELFERSIKKSPELVSQMTFYQFMLLHLAVIRRRHHFVKLLIATDQNLVNMIDFRSLYDSASSHESFAPRAVPHEHVKNATPLHYACLVQDMELAKILLEAGADWTRKDWKGRLPEELVHAPDLEVEELKSTFVQLRDAEGEKRRKEEEERCKAEEEREKKEQENGGEEKEREGEEKVKGEEEETKPVDAELEKSDNPEADGGNTDDGDSTPSKVSIESLLYLESAISEKLVGQRGPIRAVANAIRLRESHWVDPDRPLTMLFLGSSGVGKTELAKQLALLIHGKDGTSSKKGDSISKLEENHGFVRLDMSEYQERHTVFNLIGSPKSYVGYGDGGALTRPLKENPKAIVLLDEIEKAHPDVLITFLQVFDDGRIRDSQDGVISCKDAIFIMTSNIAADQIKEAAPRLRLAISQSEEEGRADSYFSSIQEFTRSIRPELKKHLKRDEFVGRINQVVVFLPLSQEEIEHVVRYELEIWRKRAEAKHKITLTWTDEVVRKLAKAYDVNYGVRSVANEVQRIAVQLVADAYIRGQIADSWHCALIMNDDEDITMIANSPPQEKWDVDIDAYFTGFRTEQCIHGLH